MHRNIMRDGLNRTIIRSSCTRVMNHPCYLITPHSYVYLLEQAVTAYRLITHVWTRSAKMARWITWWCVSVTRYIAGMYAPARCFATNTQQGGSNAPLALNTRTPAEAESAAANEDGDVDMVGTGSDDPKYCSRTKFL